MSKSIKEHQRAIIIAGVIVAALTSLQFFGAPAPAEAQTTPVEDVQPTPHITGNASWQGTTMTIKIPYDRPLTRPTGIDPISATAFTFTVGDPPARFACGGSNNMPGVNCMSKPALPTVSSVVMSGNDVVLNVNTTFPYQSMTSRGRWMVPGIQRQNG